MEDNELSEFETDTGPQCGAVSSILGPAISISDAWLSPITTKERAQGLSVEEYVAQELDYLIGSTQKACGRAR